MKYSIPYKRDLNGKEKEILVFLFKNEKQEWLSLIKDLKVIARCGCGNCPTIFFGKNFNDEVSGGELLIDYYVESKNQGLVGFSVFGNKKMPLQLEFYSIDGLKEISGIPENFHKGKKQNMNE